MKTDSEVMEISHTVLFTHGSARKNEYYHLCCKGNYYEDAFSYAEIVAIHELTARVIAEHEKEETGSGQK